MATYEVKGTTYEFPDNFDDDKVHGILASKGIIPAPGPPAGKPPVIPALTGKPDSYATQTLKAIPASAAKLAQGFTQGFGPQAGTTPAPPAEVMQGGPGHPFGNMVNNTAGEFAPLAHMIAHPIDSLEQDPVGTANAAGNGLRGLYEGATRIKSPLTVDPRIAVTRALRPTPSDPGFSDRLPDTMSLVRASNPGFKPSVENGKLNLIGAANKAINVHQDALQPWLDRAAGQTISGQPIVQATEKATSGMLPSEGMSGDALVNRARQDYTEFTPQQLRDRLSLLNDRLSSYYSQAPGKQSAALADIPDAVLKAQRDAAADTLYRHLDPENEGAGPRLIQSRTGDLMDLRDAALRRNNAIVAEQPLTPFGKIVDPIKSFAHQLLPGKANAGLAFAEGSEGRSLPLLRRAFNATDENAGINSLGTLPQPGPRMLPAPPDTSGPLPRAASDLKSVGSPFAPRQLALPAATSPIGVSGTIVPDIIGRSSRGSGSPQGLLPAPAPGIAPVNVLPTGPGAIGPSGTVPVNSTEAPRLMKGQLGGRLLDYLGGVRGKQPQP